MSYIVSISDLMSDKLTIRMQEEADRKAIRDFTTMSVGSASFSVFADNLLKWATAGFPTNYMVYILLFNHPPICYDGVARPDVYDYIAYLGEPTTITDHISVIDTQLEGMSLTYISNLPTSIGIFVNKTI